MSELLACPFCGGEAHTYKNNLWHVACENANNSCVTMSAFITEAEAIAAWNTRTPETVYAVGGIIAQATCKDVCASINEFTCSACGFNCDLASWISLFDGDDGRHRHHHHGTPNYCPNCGARRVGE